MSHSDILLRLIVYAPLGVGTSKKIFSIYLLVFRGPAHITYVIEDGGVRGSFQMITV